MNVIARRTTAGPLPDAMRLGPVHLAVRDLDRSVEWYQRALGLHDMGRQDARVVLGDGTSPVLVLHEDRDAAPRARTAGLYHYALLHPSRAELARAAVRLVQEGIPVEGASDHRTHEAVYLSDPDGIGIELARDRPRSEWPEDWGYGSGPDPLDVVSLLREVDGEAPSPRVGEGLRIGHVHLTVNDIDAARSFYVDGIGLGVTADLGSAVFYAAGPYHHHVATNVWRGAGIPPHDPGAVGIVRWTLELPDQESLTALAARLRQTGSPVREDGDMLDGVDPAGIPFRALVVPEADAGPASIG